MARTHAVAPAAALSALDSLDAPVRDDVRRHGVDPLTDVAAVRRFAHSAVRAHDQRSLSGIVRPIDDPDRVIDELVARVAGFGPLQPYLDDPSVEEIWINEPHPRRRNERRHGIKSRPATASIRSSSPGEPGERTEADGAAD